MAGLFPFSDVSIRKPNKLKTTTFATNLLQAIENFNGSYNHLPDFKGITADFVMEGDVGENLLIILLGKEPVSSAMQNKQQIAFLKADITTNKQKGGLLYPSSGGSSNPLGFYDAWGKPLHVRLDLDHDGAIEDPFKPGTMIRDKVVIVYSYGEDGKPNTEDDVKSWSGR